MPKPSDQALAEVTKAEGEVAKAQSELERLKKLEELYPDLKRYEGRWKKVAHYSNAVNGIVTNFDARHNCGCCSDSPLEIWPYLETPFGKVYSNPPKFTVGERYYDGGDRPYANWEKPLKEAGIPENIITRVKLHFTSEEPTSPEPEIDF